MVKPTPAIMRDAGEGFGAALPALSLKSRSGRGSLSPAQRIEIVENAGRIVLGYEPQLAFFSHGTPSVGHHRGRARAPRTTSPGLWRLACGHRRGIAANAPPPRLSLG